MLISDFVLLLSGKNLFSFFCSGKFGLMKISNGSGISDFPFLVIFVIDVYPKKKKSCITVVSVSEM